MLDITKIFTDFALSATGAKPSMDELGVSSSGHLMNGIMMMPAGDGPNPTVVLLHGYPGNERNLFLAEALRMIGCNVLFFHYRGAWGSPGKFSLSNVLEDAAAAIDFVKSDDIAAPYKVDKERIFLVGQSMGGFAALLTAADRADLKGTVALAPFDFASSYEHAKSSPVAFAQFSAVTGTPSPQLDYVSPVVLLDELAEKSARWVFPAQAEKLAGKNLCVVSFKQDDVSVPAMHFDPLVAACKGDNFTFIKMDGDHSYCGQKMAVSRTVCEWICKMA